jgi:acetolactate synthase-1/2/3 large subunit
MRGRKAEADAELAQRLAPQVGWLNAIRAELPENGIFVDELTQIGYVGRLALPVYRPRSYISSGYQGTLGWGVATAIGAKAARMDTPLVAISGDGGFMFNVQELATAVQHNIPVVIILTNDNAYGNVRRTQVEVFGNRVIASDLKNPDFTKLAESFGVMGLRATTPGELRAQLRKALAAGVPALIEVPVGPMPSPWGILRFTQPSRPR